MIYSLSMINKFQLTNNELCFGRYKCLELHYSNGKKDPIVSHGTADIIFIGTSGRMPYTWIWAPVK